MPIEEAKVPVWDRGFIFGDAIYEVFRLFEGRLWLEAEHVDRLRRSLAEMEFPPVDLDTADATGSAGRSPTSEVTEARTAYIQVTRGVAPRAHAFPDPPVPPTELIIIKAYDDTATARAPREAGVSVISHPDLRWGRCDVKSTNLLGNVLALEHAKRAGAYEAILVDRDGLVTEATHSSVLWVRDGRLEGTPRAGPRSFPGRSGTSSRSALTPDAGHPVRRDSRHARRVGRAATRSCCSGRRSRVLPVVSIVGQSRRRRASPGRSAGGSRRRIRRSGSRRHGSPRDGPERRSDECLLLAGCSGSVAAC